MDRKMYFMEGTKAYQLEEHAYQQESDLQAIVADNPDLLVRAWGGKEDNKLFLVQREQFLQAEEDVGNSFSLDHLLIDTEGVPVLVEVKRSSDTRIRREVVAQMLDYACRIKALDITKLQEEFERSNPDIENLSIPDGFWDKVQQNINAEHFRLVFVADEIPDTLRILIEFMDRSMGNIEVYGVEIKTFKRDQSTILSSNVIGNSLSAPKTSAKPNSGWNPTRDQPWTEEEFIHLLVSQNLSDCAPVVRSILDFTKSLNLTCKGGVGLSCPSMFIRKDGTFVFSITADYKKNKCTLDFNTEDLPTHLNENWDQKKVRNEIVDLPSRKDAENRRYIWYTATGKWQYLNVRALKKEEDMKHFQSVIRALVADME